MRSLWLNQDLITMTLFQNIISGPMPSETNTRINFTVVIQCLQKGASIILKLQKMTEFLTLTHHFQTHCSSNLSP